MEKGTNWVKILISDQALEWFKREVQVEAGQSIRFYTKIYGTSPIREGYALGFTVDTDLENAVETTKEGITFYVEERDLWFFEGYDLLVGYDEKLDEVAYEYSAK